MTHPPSHVPTKADENASMSGEAFLSQKIPTREVARARAVQITQPGVWPAFASARLVCSPIQTIRTIRLAAAMAATNTIPASTLSSTTTLPKR